MSDTMLECLKSVVVAGVGFLKSTPEVNQSKAALAGSVVVIEVVVVQLELIEFVLEIEAVLLPLEFVVFAVEVSQSKAALIGSG